MWNGSADLTFDECYSSYSHREDIIERKGTNSFQVSSSATDYGFNPNLVLQGYFCFHHYYFICMSPDSGSYMAWWLLDLGEVINLDSIVIVPINRELVFKSITISFGNTSNPLDNPSFKLIEFIYQENTRYPFVVKPANTLIGQYVGVSSPYYFCMGSIQIYKKS